GLMAWPWAPGSRAIPASPGRACRCRRLAGAAGASACLVIDHEFWLQRSWYPPFGIFPQEEYTRRNQRDLQDSDWGDAQSILAQSLGRARPIDPRSPEARG